jgi:hypothetical protein
MPVALTTGIHSKLLCFLLLLLADADLEMKDFRVLERLVIVARHSIGKVLVHVRVLRQNGHQSKVIVAGRAKGPEPLDVRNCHNFI